MSELTRPRVGGKPIPAGTLSQLEHGHRLPRPNELDRLERAYGRRDLWYAVDLIETKEE